MVKLYMVVANGTSKEKHEPYSRACRVAGDRADTFAYLDVKDVYYTKDRRPLGEIIKVEVKEI
jgi:hypothetical protein